MRKTFIIVGILVVLIGIGVAAYFVFFGPAAAHLTVGTSPFADTTGSGTVTTNPAVPANEVAGNAGTVIAPNLIQITTSPVSAGEVAFDIAPTVTSTTSLSTSSTTVATSVSSGADIGVNYIDRESGNIYSYRAHARSLTRISDKTIPGIQQVSWLPNGSLAFVRYLSDAADGTESLETYALPSDGSNGYFLPEGLDEAQIMGSSTTLFTLAAGTDNAIGMLQNANGGNAQQLFTSPLSSLIVDAAGSGYIAVTKAASELDGYAFSINPVTGGFTPIIGPLRGLTVLPSPSGKEILYSYTDGTNLHMSVFNMSDGSLTDLPLATLAEKCVWTSDSAALYCAIPTTFSGNLPDDWYQGATSFSDRIWRIDLSSRLATLTVDLSKTAHVEVDAVNLTIDPQSQVLVFRNKRDDSLWAYSL